MARKVARRLPAVKTLYEMLPTGAEGGKEFARLVDLLLFHDGRRTNNKIGLFSDVAGDYHGMDSFAGDSFRKEGTTGYQYKFFPSPLSDQHRRAVVESLQRTASSQRKLKLKKWVLVTPQNLIESASRKDGGDVTWFESLREKLGLKFELAHWGHNQLLAMLLETPSLCLFYYPELVPEGATLRRTIQRTRELYDENIINLYRDIQFVGMNVREQEAARGVPMEHIYIPLTVIPEGADEQDPNTPRIDPRTLLGQNARCVVLGDPGSGKSTLLRFLALAGISEPLRKRYGVKPDQRLPILIALRRYADELKTRANLSLINYIHESVQADFNLTSADMEFFEYYLESGQAILLFDGMDELPGSHFKEKVRDQIRTLITTYPGNTTIVSSRVVGYDNPFRFDENEFSHHRLSKLRLPEMKQFVEDWYQVRIGGAQDRKDHVRSLVRILENPEQKAIYDLAENPLLLTIIALVHRIDGVLPDARVILYKICTETLLESWHRWKFRNMDVKNRGREVRRNKQRMEAIAHWMQVRSAGAVRTQRAVIHYTELSKFLTKFIRENETQPTQDDDPEDLANEFLRFVKERAGLLVELGDKEYSFVHLTFQEYLAASYIKTNSELEGIAKTWENIKGICYESWWHEVMRLLIASLDSNASQQFMVGKLLAYKLTGRQSAKAQLLGGLLLDGVEAAEEHKEDILRELLEAGADVVDVEQLRPTNAVLSSWVAKERANADLLCSVLKRAGDERNNKRHRLGLMLMAPAVDMPKAKQLELAHNVLPDAGIDAELFHLLFGAEPLKNVSPTLIRRATLLWATQDFYTLDNPTNNFIAAVCQSVTAFMSAEVAAKRLFDQQLISLFGSSLQGFGPFRDFTLNTCLFIQEAPGVRSLLPARTLKDEVPRAKVLFQAIRNVGAQQPDATEDISLSEVIQRARLRMEGLAQGQNVADTKAHLDLGSAISYSRDPFRAKLFSDPAVHTLVINTLCDTLRLEPRAQWSEALRIGFMPRIQCRIPQLNGRTWDAVEASLADGSAGETEEFIAAWLLFFDSWLYIHECYASPKDSPFGNLARRTLNSAAPPLTIAHCIRAMAFGDESRTAEFSKLVDSDAPEYRSIFERCYLSKVPSDKIARASKMARKAKKSVKPIRQKGGSY